jgi:CheY-like chemotaxis protein
VAGTGTTFWVEFALAPGAVPVAALAAGKKPEANDEYTARGSMLYIEDNPANVFLMEHIARRMSIHCVTAHNAELGIILATSQKPDLIVMDLNLPQMSGYDALAQLKQNPATATIPVIALSANAMKDDIARGLAAGFLCYHTKPIDVEEMTGTIGNILGGRQ